MKKFLFGTVFAGIVAAFSFVPAITFAQTNTSANGAWGQGGSWLNSNSTAPGGVDVSWGKNCGTDPALICGIKSIVNWVLWLLALIALLILLWAGFKMLTANGDSKQYDEWFTILKQAAVGLAFIAASWIIVQFIMYVIKQFVG